MEKRYYICDRRRKVRLRQTHRTLGAAVARCQKLNEQYDAIHGGTNAVFFCGDWCDVSIAAGYIDETREWPWAEAPSVSAQDLENMASLCRFMISRTEGCE